MSKSAPRTARARTALADPDTTVVVDGNTSDAIAKTEFKAPDALVARSHDRAVRRLRTGHRGLLCRAEDPGRLRLLGDPDHPRHPRRLRCLCPRQGRQVALSL